MMKYWVIKTSFGRYLAAKDRKFVTKRSEAMRFHTADEARLNAVLMREQGIPAKAVAVGRGLGVRMSTAEATALNKVATRAEILMRCGYERIDTWSQKMDLSNALAELRRIRKAPPTGGDAP